MPHKRTLAILFPWNGQLAHAEILEGFQAIAHARGYTVLCMNGTFHDWSTYLTGPEVSGWMDDWQGDIGRDQIAGWAVVESPGQNRWLLALHNQQIPVVQIIPARSDPEDVVVVLDNPTGAQLVVEHLIQHGHSRIAFIGALGHPDIQARYAGYRQALERHGIALDPTLIIDVNWRPDYWVREAGGEAIARLDEQGQHYTAIFAVTDALAYGAIAALEQRGRRVPSDVAVVGFDNAPEAAITNPPLTTVNNSFRGIGETAAHYLSTWIQDGSLSAGRYTALAELIIRRSCGCTPTYQHTIVDTPQSDRIDRDQLAANCAMAVNSLQATHLQPVFKQLIDMYAHALGGMDQAAWLTQIEPLLERICRAASLIEPVYQALWQIEQQAGMLMSETAGDQAAHGNAARLMRIADRSVGEIMVRYSIAERDPWRRITSGAQLIAEDLVNASLEEALALRWLTYSAIAHGFVMLYRQDPHAPGDPAELEVCGTYANTGSSLLTKGTRYPVDAFPPQSLLDAIGSMPLKIFSISTPTRSMGLLCLVSTVESSIVERIYMWSWSSQLALIFERDALLVDLKQSNATLSRVYDQERAMLATINDLSAPVIPISAGIVVIPLIGVVAAERAERIMESVLEAIVAHRADSVILDITGVPVIDTLVASYLMRAANGARLLGAHVVLTGIRPEIAQTIVSLGIDTTKMVTLANLESGLRHALKLQKKQIIAL